MSMRLLLRLHVLVLLAGVALGALPGCAEPPYAPESGQDGVAPEPRDPDDVALKSGLSCQPRAANGYVAGARRSITVVDVDGRPVAPPK